jgi:hypothetical protein
LSFLFFTIMSGLFAKTSLSVYIPWFHKTVILVSSCSFTGLDMWEYQFSAVFILLLLLLLLLSSSSSSLLLLLISSCPYSERQETFLCSVFALQLKTVLLLNALQLRTLSAGTLISLEHKMFSLIFYYKHDTFLFVRYQFT